MRRTTHLVLLMILCLLLVGCGTGEPVETTAETREMTLPTQTEETLTPVYTRPQEEETEPNEEYIPEDEQETVGYDGEQTEGETDTGSSETGSTVTGGALVSKPLQSNGNLTWAAIRAFPVKSSAMSVRQLRSLCVDFFRFTKTAMWTPSESITYISGEKMNGGALYGGLPYVGLGSGNIYRLMDYLDESTGVVDMRDALDLERPLDKDAMTYFGNQCSYGSFVGWGRVINSTEGLITAWMTKAHGYIPIGEYTYDTQKINAWQSAAGYRTTDVVRANGDQVMYRSYAKLQLGDGLVYYTTAGHVIMCSSEPHVEYASGGKIDGNKSYITIIDQGGTWEKQTAANGKVYTLKQSVDAKITFEQLYNSNYVPFTFGEFLGTDPVEETACSFSHSGSTITEKELFSGRVTSNYGITDVYITMIDGNGVLVSKYAVRNTTPFNKTLRLAKSGAHVDRWGLLKSGTYTVEVEAQLSTGERPTVYTGTLTVS